MAKSKPGYHWITHYPNLMAISFKIAINVLVSFVRKQSNGQTVINACQEHFIREKLSLTWIEFAQE